MDGRIGGWVDRWINRLPRPPLHPSSYLFLPVVSFPRTLKESLFPSPGGRCGRMLSSSVTTEEAQHITQEQTLHLSVWL